MSRVLFITRYALTNGIIEYGVIVTRVPFDIINIVRECGPFRGYARVWSDGKLYSAAVSVRREYVPAAEYIHDIYIKLLYIVFPFVELKIPALCRLIRDTVVGHNNFGLTWSPRLARVARS